MNSPPALNLRNAIALIGFALAVVPVSQQPAAETPSATVVASQPSSGWVEWIYSRHIEGVGLVLIGRDEVATKDDGITPELLGLPLRFESLRSGPFYHPVLRGKDGEGMLDRFVLVARLQNSLDVEETEPQPGTYQWISDDIAGEFWQVDAALIMDAYFRGFGPLLRYNADDWAFHLRFGYSWDRSTESGAEADHRDLFLGASAHPFPKKETIGRFQHTQMNLGLLYQEDAVKNAHQWTVNLNLHPVFPLLPNRSFVIGEKMTWKEILGQVVTEDKATAKPGASNLEAEDDEKEDPFIYIKPNISLDALMDDFSEDGDVDFEDYNVSYGVRLGWGFWNDKVELSYSATGVSPINNFSSNHIFQEARLQIQPIRHRPLYLTAKYTHGERAPSFEKEDRVTLAVGLRF